MKAATPELREPAVGIEPTTYGLRSSNGPSGGQSDRGAEGTNGNETVPVPHNSPTTGSAAELNVRRAALDTKKIVAVLNELIHERLHQHAKFGQQDHPDGTGGGDPRAGGNAQALKWMADLARVACDAAFRDGNGTWLHILAEEFAEARAETGPKLREELIQVAAVCVAWIEAIDRRLP